MGNHKSLLACMQVSDYKTSFSPMHLVFLELDTHHCHLNFELLDHQQLLLEEFLLPHLQVVLADLMVLL